jgi:hypothetical protein
MSNQLKKIPKPKKERKKAKEKQVQTPPRAIVSTLWKLFGGAAIILGFIVAVVNLLPRLTANVSDPVDPDNPFSASVTITNTGYVPLSSVNLYYGLGQMTFGNPAMPSHLQRDESMKGYPLFESTKWHPSDLGLDDKFTVGLNDVWGKQPYLLSGDMTIVIQYRIPIIRWKREKTFLFTAEKQTNGHFYWYAKAP